MLGWYYKVFQTIRNYQEISFNVKIVILGQELAIWLGGPESALPLVFFSALYELIRSIIPHLGQKFWIWDVSVKNPSFRMKILNWKWLDRKSSIQERILNLTLLGQKIPHSGRKSWIWGCLGQKPGKKTYFSLKMSHKAWDIVRKNR